MKYLVILLGWLVNTGANSTNQQLRNSENSLYGEAGQSYSSLILSTESLRVDTITARVKQLLSEIGVYCLCVLNILNIYLDLNN